ncbi:hypothetical protein TNCV_4007651 [Trichonephila clavipes]|nr:hypothetical protein TNCV_4007651 [Trichonephila clavipes]
MGINFEEKPRTMVLYKNGPHRGLRFGSCASSAGLSIGRPVGSERLRRILISWTLPDFLVINFDPPVPRGPVNLLRRLGYDIGSSGHAILLNVVSKWWTKVVLVGEDHSMPFDDLYPTVTRHHSSLRRRCNIVKDSHCNGLDPRCEANDKCLGRGIATTISMIRGPNTCNYSPTNREHISGKGPQRNFDTAPFQNQLGQWATVAKFEVK